MNIRPLLDYQFLGAGITLDSTRIYKAEPATNQPDHEALGLVFCEESTGWVLLGRDEYEIIEAYDDTPAYIEVYYSYDYRDWVADTLDAHGHYVDGTMELASTQSYAIFKATFESSLPVHVYTKAGGYKKTLLLEADTGEWKTTRT